MTILIIEPKEINSEVYEEYKFMMGPDSSEDEFEDRIENLIEG